MSIYVFIGLLCAGVIAYLAYEIDNLRSRVKALEARIMKDIED